jgi:hypothetical protein
MRRGADAAPSRSRNVGLTTLVLAGLCLLGLATSQAVAQGLPQQTPTGPTTTTVATAPAPPPPVPDPRPAPKPDPKPAGPRRAVRPKAPPPPPPPVERAARRPIATTALPPTVPPKARTRHRKAVPPKRPRAAAALRPRGKPPRVSTRRARGDRPSVRRRKPVAPNRSTPAASEEPALDLALTSAPVLSRSQSPSKPAIPKVLLLLCLGIVLLGIVLLLGAWVASARREPWPEFAEPLHAHRRDLATVGIGAIAVAFLCLNAAVLL